VNTLFGLSDYRRSVTEGIRALALADSLEDAVLRAQLGYRLGASYHMLGDFPRAIAILRDAVTLSAGEHLYARPGAATLPSVIARVWLALSQAETGSFAESLAMADEAMQIATAADHPFSLSFACWALGQVSLRRGDLERATSALVQGREIGRVWGIGNLFLTCGAALCYARALLGHDAEAQRLIDEAGASRASRGLRWLQSLRDGWYAEAHLLADRVDEARGLAHDALRMAEAHEEIGCRAWVLRLLGDIAARGGPPGVEEAGAHFRQALTLAGSLGMRPLLAHCHLDLSRLCQRMGKRQEALEHFTTAMTMYREMDMGFWLEKAEAELGPSEDARTGSKRPEESRTRGPPMVRSKRRVRPSHIARTSSRPSHRSHASSHGFGA
jgi:tetratricopeptide (TPR) repeat protein